MLGEWPLAMALHGAWKETCLNDENEEEEAPLPQRKRTKQMHPARERSPRGFSSTNRSNRKRRWHVATGKNSSSGGTLCRKRSSQPRRPHSPLTLEQTNNHSDLPDQRIEKTNPRLDQQPPQQPPPLDSSFSTEDARLRKEIETRDEAFVRSLHEADRAFRAELLSASHRYHHYQPAILSTHG